MYLNDVATIPANLAGVPGISVPAGLAPEDGLPVGIQFLAPAARTRASTTWAARSSSCCSPSGAHRSSTGHPDLSTHELLATEEGAV
jgi:aspartyl-tRNA(Asn)/glutamyl-tRNA(Gln) amidotransferase subunit A